MGNCGSFARAALSPLKLAMAVYPEARVNIDERPVSSFTPPLPRQRTEGSQPVAFGLSSRLSRSSHASTPSPWGYFAA